MQNHSLRVGEQLVIEDRIRLTILGVEEDEVFLGITTEANAVPDPVARPWQLQLMAVPEPLLSDN